MMSDYDIATISLNSDDPICGVTTVISSKAGDKTVREYINCIYGSISDDIVTRLASTFTGTDLPFNKLMADKNRNKDGRITMRIV